LIGAVEGYFKDLESSPPDTMRYHPNNFFGQKAYFLGYLSDAETSASEAANA
jgi:hypothetical protein